MKFRFLCLCLAVSLFGQVCQGATWYIRPDGGNRSQCSGTANNPYTGHGKQACGFSHPRFLYTDGSYGNRKWIIAGGDTVVIAKGAYRIGYLGPRASDHDGSCPGDPYGCGIPSVPSGTASRHTKIVGEDYHACRTKAELYGGYGAAVVLSLVGSKHVDVQCIELTDHSECSRVGSGLPVGEKCVSTYPLSDYAGSGIATNLETSDVLLQDLDIHGFTSRGIIGALGGTLKAVRVRIAFNGGAGWDLDDGHPSPTAAAAVNASYLLVEGNGCNEEYPIRHAFPAHNCFDQDHGGYGDGLGTPDMRLDFHCNHCTFRYNTQDGLDLLHATGGTVEVRNSSAVANMGQQWKIGSARSVRFENNLTEHNCSRMSAPIADSVPGYNKALSLFCRAAGDGIAVTLGKGGRYSFIHNTYIGYGTTSFDFGCDRSGCTNATIDFQNNIVVGYQSPRSGQKPGVFYFGGGDESKIWGNRSNNIFFNMRTCPATFPRETCSDPRLIRLPPWKGEGAFDQINPHLTWSSPARNSGVALPGVVDDIEGTPWQATPSIGAFEFK